MKRRKIRNSNTNKKTSTSFYSTSTLLSKLRSETRLVTTPVVSTLRKVNTTKRIKKSIIPKPSKIKKNKRITSTYTPKDSSISKLVYRRRDISAKRQKSNSLRKQ
jgi:hypothetical protein